MADCDPLEASWSPSETSWGTSKTSWGTSRVILLILVASAGNLKLTGALCGLFGPLWGLFGHIGSYLGTLGAIWAHCSRGFTKVTVLSCPDDRTITSFISIGVKSDRTVTSTYVFGAKMGLLTVFCLPFQKRLVNPFHFCCRVNSCYCTHFKKKKSIPTQL